MSHTPVFMVVNLSITDAESYRNYEKAAKNWYADGDYQARSEHRRAGTKLEFRTLVHGMPERD